MKQVLRAAFGFLMLWAAVLHTEVRIEITQRVDSARPIGVVPFQWAGQDAVPEDVDDIVTADLRNSGKFNPLGHSRLPQQPTSTQEVQPAAWSALGIDVVIVGQVASNPDGSYQVAYQLVDTGSASGTTLARGFLKVTKQYPRYAAHVASDAVFERLTGIKGAFRIRIAYVVQKNSGQFPYELRVSGYNGYNQFLVHRSSQPLVSPAWSPDSSKLAYVTFEGGRSALVVQTLANGAMRQITPFLQHNDAPAFSPDGSKLAFALSKTGSLNLYVMDLGSGQIRQVTNDRSNNTKPSWFPDGQNLTFTSGQIGRPQVYKVNINGGTPQRITWEDSQNQDADVNADGKTMVMINSAGGQQYIAKQDLEAGGAQVLPSTFLDETPSLAPNGAVVIYSSSQGMGSVPNLVSTDGHFKARLPATDGQVKLPAWPPYL